METFALQAKLTWLKSPLPCSICIRYRSRSQGYKRQDKTTENHDHVQCSCHKVRRILFKCRRI